MSSWHGTSAHGSACTAASSFYYNQVHQFASEPIRVVMWNHLINFAAQPLITALSEVLSYYVVQITCTENIAPQLFYMYQIVGLLMGVVADSFSDASYIISQKVPVTKTSDTNSVYFTYGIAVKTVFVLILLLLFGVLNKQIYEGLFAGLADLENRHTAYIIVFFGSILTTCQFRETERFLFMQLKSDILNMKSAAELIFPLISFMVVCFWRQTRGSGGKMLDFPICYLVGNALVECGILLISAVRQLKVDGIHTHLQLKRLVPFKKSLVLLTLLKSLHNFLYQLPEALLFMLTLYLQFGQPATFVQYATAHEIAAAIYVLLARVSRLPQQITNAFLLQFCGTNMAQQKFRRISQLYKSQMIYALVTQFVFCFLLYLVSGLICDMIVSGVSQTTQELFAELGLIKEMRLASFYGVLTFPLTTAMQVLRIIVLGRDTAMNVANCMQLVAVMLVFGASLLWGRTYWVMHNLLACAMFQFCIGITLNCYVVYETSKLEDATTAVEQQESSATDRPPDISINGLQEVKLDPMTLPLNARSNLTSSRKSDNQASMFFQTTELPNLQSTSKEAASASGDALQFISSDLKD